MQKTSFDNVELERYRTALTEQAIEQKANAPSPPPSSVPAEIRPLPYPFNHFFSITNDCDNPDPSLNRWRHVGETIRLKNGLPISDSIFVDWPIQRGENHNYYIDGFSKEIPQFNRDRYIDANFFLLQQFHRGWFDVIHGWIMSHSIRIAHEVSFYGGVPRRNYLLKKIENLTEGGNENWVKWENNDPILLGGKQEDAPNCCRIRFFAPKRWLQDRPIRYFYFKYALPMLFSKFDIRGYVGQKKVFDIRSGKIFDPHWRQVPLPVLIDLIPLVGNDPEKLKNIEIEFELHPNETADTAQFDDVTLFSEVRQDIKDHIKVLDLFNLRLSSFSSHGIGMVFGATSQRDPASCDPRFHSDYLKNPNYFKDISEQAGVEFFNTFTNTYHKDIQTIDTVLHPVIFNDGSVGYDFYRYFYAPRTQQNTMDYSVFQLDGRMTDASSADYLGYHIHGALENMTQPASGALIYTHAGVRCWVHLDEEEKSGDKARDTFESIYGESLEALSDLADRYYNLSGTLKDEERIWVAGTAVVCRYAQVRRYLQRHSRYDRNTNAVWIETWFDPITKLPVPNPAKEFSDLRGATFFVEDALTAKVFVDGREVSHLIRNQGNHDGRPSVTIADVRTPTVIFDEVDVWEKGSCSAEAAMIELNEEFAFRGQRSLKLTALSERGRVIYQPRVPVDLYNNQYLRFAYRKLAEEASIGVRLRLSGGAIWGAAEAGGAEAGHLVELPAYDDQDWHDIVIPYWQFIAALPVESRTVPPEMIHKIEFDVKGVVLIDCLELLRDNDAPAPTDGCHVIGGTILPLGTTKSIFMTLDEKEFHTHATQGGHYMFEKRVPRGAIIRLQAETIKGERVEPISGPFHEVWRDCLDYDFYIV